MNIEYRIEVAWSDEDQAWIADVPDLAFCSAHGQTAHDAVAEVERAADAWVEAAVATGRQVPQPQTRAARA